MRKPISILVLISLLGVFLQMLNGCSGCCSDYPNCISINNIKLEALDYADSIVNYPENNTVRAKDLILRFTINKNVKTCRRSQPALSLMNSAYAFSCGEDNQYIDSITYFVIYSNIAYDDNHPAGSDLKDLFLVPEPEELNVTDEVRFKDMYALEAPKDTGTHIFTIGLLLQDGRLLETNTELTHVTR